MSRDHTTHRMITAPDGTRLKWCADCNDYLPLDRFHKRGKLLVSGEPTLTGYCKKHHNKRTAARKQQLKTAAAEDRRALFGITRKHGDYTRRQKEILRQAGLLGGDNGTQV